MGKTITVLGSTGSIGTQCLDVCSQQGYTISTLIANSNIDLLEKQAREMKPQNVIIMKKELVSELRKRLANTDVRVWGEENLAKALEIKVDIVVNAITGIAGLVPTLIAIEAGNHIALANKETLVTAGEIVMKRAAEKKVNVYPIDSEHSAIWQCLEAGNPSQLEKIYLTASGGPFYGKKESELESVSVEQALAHPNWDMGNKISIDSATLMNKGLELIEAMWLFNVTSDQVEIVVHRQSIVHSAVEFVDGSVIAQMGVPDMRTAIQYAITYPERLPIKNEKFSFSKYSNLTFEQPDYKTFTSLNNCIKAAVKGGLSPTILNGANEKAVELFLAHKISFLDISRLVGRAVDELEIDREVSLENVLEADRRGREFVSLNI